MKDEKIVNAFDRLQPGDEVKNRIYFRAMQRQRNKRPVFKAVASFAAAAAVICLLALGANLLSPQSGNAFAIKAYAMEQMDDGTIELREVDLLGDKYYWSTYNDGSIFYVSANLKCEGENIKRVDFYTDDGFFAKQYLKIEDGKIITEEGVPASYRKAPGDTDYTLVMYGEDFDIIGSSFTLGKGDMTDDYLLFLGNEVSNRRDRPSQMTIRAVATFTDGKTQEETVTLDLSEGEIVGTGIFKLPPEEIARMNAEHEKYMALLSSIPLDRCEVIPDTVQELTYGDYFEYSTDRGIGDGLVVAMAIFEISEVSMSDAYRQGLFDEDGIFRVGSNLHRLGESDGSDGFIAVILDNGDGTYTGMVYNVPGWLILEHKN